MFHPECRFVRLPGGSLPAALCGLMLAMGFGARLAVAQSTEGAPAAGAAAAPYTSDDLEALVGPIALYPDDLVAVILPAAAYPVQIVQAARYLEAAADDPSLAPDPHWDDAVVALLNYPELLQLMSDNLGWTERLGEAVVLQQDEVLAAIQTFRGRAVMAGNLRSDERQVVTEEEEGQIAIAPADPSVVYLPRYAPETVVVYQSVPAWGYYPRPYPVYYYPYPAGYSFAFFGARPFWGVSTAFVIGWNSFALNVYHHNYYAHPFYGWSYYRPYYSRYYVHGPAAYPDHRWYPRGHWHSDSYRRYTAHREQTRRAVSRDGYVHGGERVVPADHRARLVPPAGRANAGARDGTARRSRTPAAGMGRDGANVRGTTPREMRTRLASEFEPARPATNRPAPDGRRTVERSDAGRRMTMPARTVRTVPTQRPRTSAPPRESRTGATANPARARDPLVRAQPPVRDAGSAGRGVAFAPPPSQGQARAAPGAVRSRPAAPAQGSANRDSRGYGGSAPARGQAAPRGNAFAASPGNGAARNGSARFGGGGTNRGAGGTRLR